MKAAVIGLGQMGAGIAANLHRAGYLTAAWDLSEAACARAGVPIATLAEIAATADAVLFVVPSSKEIEVCLNTMLQVARAGQVVIDLTTSLPGDTQRLAAKAEAAGCSYLDGGMSGGATGADRGTLTLMMGGDPAALDRCRPMLDVIAAKIFHLGAAGAGHTMKLVHNMVCHTNFLALAEGCRMAEQAGLPLQGVIDVINAGNARSYISEARFPNHILSGRFDGRSRVANLAKDLGMAAELAAQLGQPAPYTALTTALLDGAVADGRAEDDFTTLYPDYEGLARRLPQ